LAGDMGEAALDTAQFRARQGAARDEGKETKKGQNAIEKRESHSKKETHKAVIRNREIYRSSERG